MVLFAYSRTHTYTPRGAQKRMNGIAMKTSNYTVGEKRQLKHTRAVKCKDVHSAEEDRKR